MERSWSASAEVVAELRRWVGMASLGGGILDSCDRNNCYAWCSLQCFPQLSGIGLAWPARPLVQAACDLYA